jgi:hypothetical protein
MKETGRARRERKAAQYEIKRLGLEAYASENKGYVIINCQERALIAPNYQAIRVLGGLKETSIEQAFNLLHPYESRVTWAQTLTQQSAKYNAQGLDNTLTPRRKARLSQWHNGMGIWQGLASFIATASEYLKCEKKATALSIRGREGDTSTTEKS